MQWAMTSPLYERRPDEIGLFSVQWNEDQEEVVIYKSGINKKERKKKKKML